MSIAIPTLPASAPDLETIPELESGDHLDQPTFHERYEQMPHGTRAELIGGVVLMPSPAKVRHGKPDGLICSWMGMYRAATPGVEFYPNMTSILGDDSEPQPDGMLVIGKGGQTRINEDGYLVGPPEFIAEIASSSASYDLHTKRRDYEKHGVQEYLIVVARQNHLVWLFREQGRYVDLAGGPDNILRSRVFPGLWLDPVAVQTHSWDRMTAVIQQGLASPEHAAFVAALAQRNAPKS